MAEVMYRCGETGTLETALALAEGEFFALHLPLDEAELGVEALSLLVVAAVSLGLREQPPIWEGRDSVTEGKVGGLGALE